MNRGGTKEGIVQPAPLAAALTRTTCAYIEDLKMRGELEAEVVKRLRGTEEASSVRQELPDGFFEDMIRDCEASRIGVAGAAELAVEKVRNWLRR